MQSAQKQATRRDVTVEGGEAEGDDRPGRARAAVLYPRDLVAQAGKRLGAGGR